jgi:transposase InsO family protein
VTLDDNREKFEAWRHHYNRNWPHSSLRNLTPHEFARQSQVVRNDEGGDFSL